LSFKADLNVKNYFGQTALSLSSLTFHQNRFSYDIFCIFLSFGCDPNCHDTLSGESCVHYLSHLGQSDFLRKLIEYKANFNLLNIYNKSPKNILEDFHPHLIKELFK
jgi:ankyrin repeat protein